MPRRFNPSPHAWTLLILVALSIGFRFVVWHQSGMTPQMAPDSASYLGPAQSLVEHNAFGNAAGSPETTRTPGYPLLLALITAMGLGLSAVTIVQHGLSLSIAILIYRLLRRSAEPHAALAAFALISMNFLLVLYSGFILSEMLFAFLVTVCFVLLGNMSLPSAPGTPAVALAALVAGIAVIVRPIGLFLVIPATLYILCCLHKQRLINGLVFVLVFSVVPAGWMIRNNLHTGNYSLSDIADINLLGYQAAGALAVKQGGDYATVHESIKQQLYAQAREEFEAQTDKKDRRSLDAIYRDNGLRILRENPGATIRHLARNTALTLLGNGATHISRITGMRQASANLLAVITSIPVLLLALAGLIISWQRHREIALLSFLFVSYFVGVSALGGVGGSRFRLPAEPILCMLAAIAVVDIFPRVIRKRH